MKPSLMPVARHALLALFAAALWLPHSESAAQESKPKPEKTPPAANPQLSAAAKDARAKIEINDSIEQLARLLEGQFEGANFVVPKTVANVRVSLTLRNVTLDQVLQAVGIATEQRVPAEEITENVYGFRLVPRTMPDGQPEPQSAVRVLSLAGAPQLGSEASPETFKKVVEELEMAFNDAIVMLREADPGSTVEQPRLKFHPSTKLLVAVGKPEELSIVEQLVGALGGGFTPLFGGGMAPNPGFAPGAYGQPGFPGAGASGGLAPAMPGLEPGGRAAPKPSSKRSR